MRFTLLLRLQPQWNRAVADAEKLVGYTGSFMSLQCLLTDEVAQLALNARKLFSRQSHPLFKTARNLFNDRSNVIQTWGLTVLLISRAANCSLTNKSVDHPVDEIFSTQRSLAEIVELICTANLIHKGIVDDNSKNDPSTSSTSALSDSKRDLTLGNKLGVLGGDFLLANASVALSKLRNTQVVNDIAQGIADMTSAEFMVDAVTLEDLHKKFFLSSGSILANSCRACLKLANHSETLQQSAYDFGKYLSVAFELNKLLRLIKDSEENPTDIFPIKFDFTKFDAVCLQRSMEDFSSKAAEELKSFKESEARKSLQNMALALSYVN